MLLPLCLSHLSLGLHPGKQEGTYENLTELSANIRMKAKPTLALGIPDLRKDFKTPQLHHPPTPGLQGTGGCLCEWSRWQLDCHSHHCTAPQQGGRWSWGRVMHFHPSSPTWTLLTGMLYGEIALLHRTSWLLQISHFLPETFFFFLLGIRCGDRISFGLPLGQDLLHAGIFNSLVRMPHSQPVPEVSLGLDRGCCSEPADQRHRRTAEDGCCQHAGVPSPALPLQAHQSEQESRKTSKAH